MTTRITSALVEAGFYYEKKGTPGWLRLILHRRGDEVVYADFTGLGRCDASTISRWTCAKYSADEAAKLFPKEAADSAKVLEEDLGIRDALCRRGIRLLGRRRRSET